MKLDLWLKLDCEVKVMAPKAGVFMTAMHIFYKAAAQDIFEI